MSTEIKACSTQTVLFMIPDPSRILSLLLFEGLMEANVNVLITTSIIPKVFHIVS